MRIQLPRSTSSVFAPLDATSNVPLADAVEDSGEGQATVRLLDLSGLEYHSLKGESVTDSKRLGLSKKLSLRRLGGKHTTSHADAGSKNDGVAATPSSPAKVVVWCHKSSPKYLNSCPLNEETMDDEGVVHSWSCVWPRDASSLNIPLPSPHEGERNSVIHLGLGVRVPGEDKIQPLGIASVNVSEDQRTTLEASVPVDPIKQKTGLFGKFGAKQSLSKSCAYAISPSTVLNVKLQVTSRLPSSQRIFDSLVMVNSHTSRKNDQGSTSGSVGTEATSSASEGSATQRMGAKSKNAALSVGGSKTVKAANTASPCDASDVFSIESVESVIDGGISKRKSIITTPGGGGLTERKLCDVIIHTNSEDSPVEETSTKKAPSVVSMHQDEPPAIQEAKPSTNGLKCTVKGNTKKPKRMFETLDRKSLMALIALKDTFDELKEAVAVAVVEPEQREDEGPNEALDHDTMRAFDDLNETFEKLKSTYSEPDHKAHASFVELKETFDKLQTTFVDLKDKNDQVEGQSSRKPKQDIYQAIDSKLFTAFVQLNRSYDKLKVTFKRKNKAENNMEVHETLDHKPMMAFVELKQTMSDISNEELTVESFGAKPKVEVLRSPQDENQEQQQQQPGPYGAFCSIAQKEWKDYCAPDISEFLENAREGLADIIACGCFTEEIYFGDDVTCRTDCTSLETYETTKYSQQESTFCASTLCTSDNNTMDTLGSISKEESQESNVQKTVVSRERELQEKEDIIKIESKKETDNEDESNKETDNKDESNKETDNKDESKEGSKDEASKEEVTKESGGRRRVGSFISRLPSLLNESESKMDASNKNESQKEASKEDTTRERGSRGRVGGFISRLPSLPSKRSPGSAQEGFTALDQLNLQQRQGMVRSNSTRSAGRPPTPAERSLLESRFKCDGSVSVYSV